MFLCQITTWKINIFLYIYIHICCPSYYLRFYDPTVLRLTVAIINSFIIKLTGVCSSFSSYLNIKLKQPEPDIFLSRHGKIAIKCKLMCSVIQMKHQLDATLCRFYFCRVTLHVSGASAHHQEYLKLVQRPLVHVLSLQVSHHISLLGPFRP